MIIKEENYWVLNLLKVIASYPLRSGRWLGWGDTISNSADDFFNLMGERGISQVISNCRENICKENSRC